MFVSIDPGITTGWAIWNDEGLLDCGLGDPRSSEKHKAEHVHDVWIESPVIYPRSKARPADITTLARGAGRWAGRYDVLAVEAHFVEPAQWKGQVPKDIAHARMWDRLQPLEKNIVERACKGLAPSTRHNVLDAVGIGLWVARRSSLPFSAGRST